VIKARLAGQPAPGPFKYFDKGTMATIGYKAAVADAFHIKVTGPIAYLMWLFIHAMYLVGWGNRIGTLYTWSRAFLFSGGRAHRIITYENARAELPRGRTRAIDPKVDAATPPGREAKQQT
jgi:NADH:ubiquinone reductase (H+-translocating)